MGIISKQNKAETEINPDAEAKMFNNAKVLNKIQSCRNLLVLSTHQLILIYFFKEIIYCFFYIFLI